MRFTPHQRVIDLLIGQRLYTSPDAAIRELLQNAQDACELQRLKDASHLPRIVVRYSVTENWVEVVDNGLGMNAESVERSFASVGAPKEEVSHIRDLLARSQSPQNLQIALFGIGVLSCFGVAQAITVRTKMDDDSGLAFVIRDYREEFEASSDVPTVRGTTVRLDLKPNGPMHAQHVSGAVERYARHAEHVEIEDVDANQRRSVPQRWNGSELPGAVRVKDPAIRAGVLALNPAWDIPGKALGSGLVVCNAGFLVTEREPSLVASQAVGYVGEIDVQPGGLTILLNREGFQRDEHWQDLGRRLTGVYNELLRAKINQWEHLLAEDDRNVQDQGIDRGILILTRGPTRQILEADLLARLDPLIPRVVRIKLWDSDRSLSIASLIERARGQDVMYYMREGEGARQVQQPIQHGSGTVHFTETIQTQHLRATHLRIKGALVVVCHRRRYSIEVGGANQEVNVHEADLVSQECQRAGIRWVAVEDATPVEVKLGAAEESILLTRLLALGEDLKLVPLPDTADRVVRDYAGRLLNCAHPEVREILRILPDAVGNPVRRALLQAYIDIDNYRPNQARQRIKELLTATDLHQQAQLTTGRLTRDYLQKKLQPLIGDEK